MILIVDGLNRAKYSAVLDDMFRLRKRVFHDRLGWDVQVRNGMEIDEFDALDPAYVLSLDDEGHVVACARALQTTGPHVLADVFSAILDGEPPLRSALVWESTRFCVDTARLGRGTARNSISYHTSELMIGSLEFAMASGITDIVTVIDPVMDRVLKRSDNAPYDYLGRPTPMGKVSALAALLDVTQERIDRVRSFSGITGDVMATELDKARILARHAMPLSEDMGPDALREYCREQIRAAETEEELRAALHLSQELASRGRLTAPARLN